MNTFFFFLVFISHPTKNGSQSFTHLTFSISLGRFETRLRTTGIEYTLPIRWRHKTFLNPNFVAAYNRDIKNHKMLHFCSSLLYFIGGSFFKNFSFYSICQIVYHNYGTDRVSIFPNLWPNTNPTSKFFAN